MSSRTIKTLFRCAVAVLAAGPALRGQETAPPGGDGFSAEFVSQAVPTAVEAGQIVPVSIQVKNTGQAPWDSSVNLVFLRRDFGDRPIPLAADGNVEPGSTKALSFSLVAPATPGRYRFQARLKRARHFMGEPSPEAMIEVRASTTGNDAKFVSQEVPPQMVPGATYSVRITMKNTGQSTWTGRQGYALHFGRTSERFHEEPLRIPLAAGESVPPGKTKSFAFDFRARSDDAPFSWRMVQAGKQYFGETTKAIRIARPALYGNLDLVDCRTIAGWAADIHDYRQPQKVALFADGVQFAFVTANRFRPNLAAAHEGHGDNSFEIPTPAFLLDGKRHSIGAFVVPSNIELTWSPKSLTCSRDGKALPESR